MRFESALHLSRTMMSKYSWRFSWLVHAAGLEHLAEHADEGQAVVLRLVADVGDELAPERGHAPLLLGREEDGHDTRDDDDARQGHQQRARGAAVSARRDASASLAVGETPGGANCRASSESARRP